MTAARLASRDWLWRACWLSLLLVSCTLWAGPRLAAAPARQSAPFVQLSEVHAAPRAVQDIAGEWIELVNLGDQPIDLRNWRLLSHQQESFLIRDSLPIAPGGYAVLARNGDPTRNGGVQPTYVYSGLDLGNLGDTLQLVDPGGNTVDSLTWGPDTGVQMTDGASLERLLADGRWVTAHAAWPGSAGDLGSPGAAYTAPPSTPVATPPETPAPTPTWTPHPDSVPRLLLSEVMIDPQAVADETGEWIEVTNGDTAPIHLMGWQLSDLDRDHHTISADLWIAPGQYLVLARHGDPAQNGGLSAAYLYEGVELGNQGDELLLLAPWGAEADRLVWQGGAQVPQGASLERTSLDPAASWTAAHAAWPGSLGDRGSPGAPYAAPTPTSTPVAPPTATAIATAPPTATPPALPAAWPLGATPSPLRIDEVYYHTPDQEFIVLRNAGMTPLALAGWLVGDAAAPGDREGLVALPPDWVLDPGALFVLAHSAQGFSARWGRPPHAEWTETDPAVLTLERQPALASGEIALNDNGDEVVLLDPQGRVADALAYGDGAGHVLGLGGSMRCTANNSLQQLPDTPYPAVQDLRHRFLLAAPDPFTARTLPTPQAQTFAPLDGGLIALWGTLGATSTFSPDGSAPPRYLVAAAAAHGLDFIAIADLDLDPVARIAASEPLPAHLLPAWRWQGMDGPSAILYTAETAALSTWAELLGFLAAQGATAQAQSTDAPADARLTALAADALTVPDGLAWLAARWQNAGMPLLPAGNTNPPLPGFHPAAPRYTGLAVSQADAGSIQAALQARRGWLTTAPGLWLTLRTAGGDWMGSAITPANQLTLHIQYGDRDGSPAGLAIWQDGQIVRQFDQPPGNGRWDVTLPAVPGSFVFAVATQLDGDFAVTAPIHLLPVAGGTVRLNEVLPAPAADLNSDGSADSGDEYIELLNPGTAPVTLAGWQLSDRAGDDEGRRVALDPSRAIGAGERLLLWRHATGLSLNDDGDRITLWDPSGAAVDSIEWGTAPSGGLSLSRIPDGGAWQNGTPPTPGDANQPAPSGPAIMPSPQPGNAPDRDQDDHPDHKEDALPPTHGQATGPPASLAAAKLQGLDREVEFRAQVIAPPGLFNSAVYVAEAARTLDGVTLPIAGLGIQVYLQAGDFMTLQEGDWVLVRGVLKSFRGEMEVQLDEPGRLWPIGPGTPLLPLPVQVGEIGEPLEGRLVTLTGTVTGWQGDSIYLGDLSDASLPAVRVTVRSSLGWKRPYVQKGERYEVTGIVSQFGRAAPWNDGYRVLVRYPSDLVRLD